MIKNVRRLVLLFSMSGLMLVLAGPAQAGSTTLISGVQTIAGAGDCEDWPSPDKEFVNPLLMTGDLQGCWYTKVDESSRDGRPNGMYRESGEEIFVGSFVDRTSVITGTFHLTYRFWAKFDWTTVPFTEIRGHCEHPIIGGTGGFANVYGRLAFKDILEPSGWTYPYRGNIKF